MSFYGAISAIYDEIFPIDPRAIEAIETLVPLGVDKRILDLGAATGGHLKAFAAEGWDTLGIELDPDMAATAALRAHVVAGSMLDAEAITASDYGMPIKFGAAICLGNTLPHLPLSAMQGFFATIRKLLLPGAPFVLQTLNYAHPEIQAGYEFPAIAAGGIKFARRYERGAAPGTLAFITEISDGVSTRTFTTPLTAVVPEAMESMLRKTGFKELTRWSGWDKKPFAADKDRYFIVAAK
jgi:glycine/sarcosine N-methyltransferase